MGADRDLRSLIAVAAGDEASDLVLKNASGN